MEEAGKGYTLEEVRDLFEGWRKDRKQRKPIPAELWEAAICLSRQYSIHKVSRYLHLSYTELKRRVGKGNGSTVVEASPCASRFIELDVMPATDISIEIEKPGGVKMTINIKGRSGLDIMEFGKAFWING